MMSDTVLHSQASGIIGKAGQFIGVVGDPGEAKAVKRLTVIDNLRGFSLLMVLAFHADLGMRLSSMPHSGWIAEYLATTELLRMPLLVFIAGFMMRGSLIQNDASKWVGSLLSNIYPFIIWSLAYSLFWYLHPTQINSRTLVDVVLTPLFPNSHLWFLQAIILFKIITIVMARLNMPPIARLALAFGVCATVSRAQLETEVSLELFSPHRDLFLFFMIGTMTTKDNLEKFLDGGRKLGKLLPFGLLASWIYVCILFPDSKYLLKSAPLSLVGIAILTVCLHNWNKILNKIKILNWFGKHSLEIYISHIALMSIIRAAMAKIGLVAYPTLFFVMLTIGSAFVSMMGVLAINRIGMRWLFRMPPEWMKSIKSLLTGKTQVRLLSEEGSTKQAFIVTPAQLTTPDHG
jgi:surface polysaccharide O-acyltransferase-like enzyme